MGLTRNEKAGGRVQACGRFKNNEREGGMQEDERGSKEKMAAMDWDGCKQLGAAGSAVGRDYLA